MLWKLLFIATMLQFSRALQLNYLTRVKRVNFQVNAIRLASLSRADSVSESTKQNLQTKLLSGDDCRIISKLGHGWWTIETSDGKVDHFSTI